ncbi:hypothetical protein ACXV6R_000384 [Yersinia enterocolitica]|nr:hypothetical protein [Yersinia enterocolitica]
MNASLAGKVFHSENVHNSIRVSMGMRKILNKVFATAIDNYYHLFALRDKASCFRLLAEKHDIAHIASSVFKPARVLAFFLPAYSHHFPFIYYVYCYLFTI